jgi:hypothetical protein
MKPKKKIEQAMAGAGSALLEMGMRSYRSGLLGDTNILEISPGRTQKETQRSGPVAVLGLTSSLVGMIPASQAIIAAPSSLDSAADFMPTSIEVDIKLTAPPVQYDKVLVQLRDVGADKPRILYDPDQD